MAIIVSICQVSKLGFGKFKPSTLSHHCPVLMMYDIISGLPCLVDIHYMESCQTVFVYRNFMAQPPRVRGSRLDRGDVGTVLPLWRGLCHGRWECGRRSSCPQSRQAAGFIGNKRTLPRKGLSWELSVANIHSSWGWLLGSWRRPDVGDHPFPDTQHMHFFIKSFDDSRWFSSWHCCQLCSMF